MMIPKLDFAWADKRWKDPLTGTQVVRLSPGRKSHFRNPYFRINMFTGDGQWMVICEVEQMVDGEEQGAQRLWAINLFNGEQRDLGIMPGQWVSWIRYSLLRHSHRAAFLDNSDPEHWAIHLIDIDTGERRRVEPRRPFSFIYSADIWADERYVYTPQAVEAIEKADMYREMSGRERLSMMAAQPGYQEMLRIDLETGEVEPVFDATDWQIGHPNPHPTYPDLLMCCQEWAGENPSSKWGAAKEHERIRVFDIKSREWQSIFRTAPLHCGHEHWALTSRRIYAHGETRDGGQGCRCHVINRIDLDAQTNTLFICPRGTAGSQHVLVAPSEDFLVGDGFNFDRTMVSDELRRRVEALETEDYLASKIKGEINLPSGGETIWKYELPEESIWDCGQFGDDPDALDAAIRENPEKAVKVSPICRFRSLKRTLMFGYRLESNAHVTPDSRWSVFQSSSEDDWFEIWAARIPGSG